MSDRWDWTRPVRDEHLAPPLDGLRCERIAPEDYWPLHEATLREHFPPEAYLDLDATASDERRRRRERLAACRGATPLTEPWALHDADGLAGLYRLSQPDDGVLQLYHVTLHPRVRGRGVYTEIVRRTLAFADALGFDSVVSEHAPQNTAALVPHLRAGFVVEALLTSAGAGPTLRLRRFLDPAHRRAFDYRCGLAAVGADLDAVGYGAWSTLVGQFQALPAASS